MAGVVVDDRGGCPGCLDPRRVVTWWPFGLIVRCRCGLREDLPYPASWLL